MLFSLRAGAREISVRLWISGGMQGVMMGNRECPGWLSVARQLALDDPDACWIQVGSPTDSDCLDQIDGLKQPDILIPTEADFRMQGREILEQQAIPGGLLNVSSLPQFPDYEPAFSKVQVWEQADKIKVYGLGLLSDLAPLTIPPGRLRPLRILPALQTLRTYLNEHPLPDQVFPVAILPEDADPKEWSDRFPDIPLLILPVGSFPQIIETHQGRQLRIQPARYGRALIRVEIYWDTVTRSFSSPKAEVVWVKGPDLQGLELPECVRQRILPLKQLPEVKLSEELLKHADAVLLPQRKPLGLSSLLPDAVRVSAVPQDDAWLKVWADRDVWKRWKEKPGFQGVERSNLPRGGMEILVSAASAAGNGKWEDAIRQDLQKYDFKTEWMSFSSRDLVLPMPGEKF